MRQADEFVGGVLERVKPEYIRRTYGIEKWADATDFLEQAPRSRRDLAETAIAEITEESLAEMHPHVAGVPLLEPHPRACPRPSQYGRKIGKLLKGAEPDVNAAAKLVLHDWQRAPRCSRDPREVRPRSARDRSPLVGIGAGGRLPYFTLPPDFTPEAAEGSRGGEGGMAGMVSSHAFIGADAKLHDEEAARGAAREEEDGEEDGEEEGEEEGEGESESDGEEGSEGGEGEEGSGDSEGESGTEGQGSGGAGARRADGVCWEDVFDEA